MLARPPPISFALNQGLKRRPIAAAIFRRDLRKINEIDRSPI
jgi:hypothetical protein